MKKSPFHSGRYPQQQETQVFYKSPTTSYNPKDYTQSFCDILDQAELSMMDTSQGEEMLQQIHVPKNLETDIGNEEEDFQTNSEERENISPAESEFIFCLASKEKEKFFQWKEKKYDASKDGTLEITYDATKPSMIYLSGEGYTEKRYPAVCKSCKMFLSMAQNDKAHFKSKVHLENEKLKANNNNDAKVTISATQMSFMEDRIEKLESVLEMVLAKINKIELLLKISPEPFQLETQRD